MNGSLRRRSGRHACASTPGVALVPLVLALAGCAGGARAESAGSSAQAFEQAMAQHDGAAACRLLAPETAAEVAQSADGSCADGVLAQDLPEAGAVQDSSVWGRSAQVRMAADTLFLSHFNRGWRVLAAGCTPRTGKPYDCTVQGG